MFEQIHTYTQAQTNRRVILVVLKRLLVIKRRLYGYGVVHEEGITHLYTWHNVVKLLALVHELAVGSKEYDILLDIVASAYTYAIAVLYILIAIVLVAHLAIQHKVVGNKIATLCLYAETELVLAGILSIESCQRTTNICFALFELCVCRCCCKQRHSHCQ